MNPTVVVLSTLTGVLVGGLFAYLGIPVPVPPKLAGLMGIVGLFVGYKLVDLTGAGVDLLGRLGVT